MTNYENVIGGMKHWIDSNTSEIKHLENENEQSKKYIIDNNKKITELEERNIIIQSAIIKLGEKK